jgi:very-short-patch-repair endonuclease
MTSNAVFARMNRKAMTEAETRIWVRVRRSQLGVRIRRQVVIGPYIADFACLALKLVIEIDGAQHWESEADALRDEYLRLHGWTVLRLSTDDVLRDPEWAVAEIAYAVEQLI